MFGHILAIANSVFAPNVRLFYNCFPSSTKFTPLLMMPKWNNSMPTILILKKRQVTVIGSAISGSTIIRSGVLQCSILRPLLFLIYINDLLDAICYSSTYVFADDSKYFSNSCIYLQRDLDKVTEWFATNKMSLNSIKCKILSFRGEGALSLCGKELPAESREKDLGLNICNNLNWSLHAKERCSKSMNALFSIKRNTSEKAPRQTKLSVCCGYIVPILTYGSQVPSYNKGDLKKLESVQRRAAKWIIRCGEVTALH